MAELNDYLESRGITEEQMEVARRQTQEYVDAYNLREARKAQNLTQVQVARAIGVSQNRVSRIENGDMGAMSVESLRRYIAALGGSLTLVADLPSGKVRLA